MPHAAACVGVTALCYGDRKWYLLDLRDLGDQFLFRISCNKEPLQVWFLSGPSLCSSNTDWLVELPRIIHALHIPGTGATTDSTLRVSCSHSMHCVSWIVHSRHIVFTLDSRHIVQVELFIQHVWRYNTCEYCYVIQRSTMLLLSPKSCKNQCSHFHIFHSIHLAWEIAQIG